MVDVWSKVRNVPNGGSRASLVDYSAGECGNRRETSVSVRSLFPSSRRASKWDSSHVYLSSEGHDTLAVDRYIIRRFFREQTLVVVLRTEMVLSLGECWRVESSLS